MTDGGQPPAKPLVWMGGSKKDLVALPAAVVDVFGYGLYLAHEVAEEMNRERTEKKR